MSCGEECLKMSKHRVTIELSREQELAISSEKNRKARNLVIGEFLLTAMEEALPVVVREAKLKKLQALKDEYEMLKKDVAVEE